MTGRHEGAYGRAAEAEIADVPESAQSVCHWLITAPVYHPAWSQYVLAVVRLDDDVPGFPPPYRKFDGATHELLVLALNPEFGRVAVEDMGRPGYQLRHLTPANIAEQFIATDEEMRQLASQAAWGVVAGHLTPETADAPERIRHAWLTSLTKTLAHIRGEAHAR